MKFFSHELAIDLGTANTVIFHKGQIALDEPSIVAIDTKTGELIAVGVEINGHSAEHGICIRSKLLTPSRTEEVCDLAACELCFRDHSNITVMCAVGGHVRCVVQNIAVGNARKAVHRTKGGEVRLCTEIGFVYDHARPNGVFDHRACT